MTWRPFRSSAASSAQHGTAPTRKRSVEPMVEAVLVAVGVVPAEAVVALAAEPVVLAAEVAAARGRCRRARKLEHANLLLPRSARPSTPFIREVALETSTRTCGA